MQIKKYNECVKYLKEFEDSVIDKFHLSTGLHALKVYKIIIQIPEILEILSLKSNYQTLFFNKHLILNTSTIYNYSLF